MKFSTVRKETPNGPGATLALTCGRLTAVAALLVVGLLFAATGAKAGCGLPYKAGAAVLIPPAGPQAQAADSWNDQDGNDSNAPASIVGLWYLVYTGTYTSNGAYLPVPSPAPPGGFPFIQSYKTWHADGTEWENAFLNPDGGNVCFGVWKDLGHGTVKLHHIGLMFSGTATMPPFQSNVFTVDETDTVSRDGKTYTGFFDFKLFGPTDVFGTGTPLQEIKGTTAGTRITVD